MGEGVSGEQLQRQRAHSSLSDSHHHPTIPPPSIEAWRRSNDSIVIPCDKCRRRRLGQMSPLHSLVSVNSASRSNVTPFIAPVVNELMIVSASACTDGRRREARVEWRVDGWDGVE